MDFTFFWTICSTNGIILDKTQIEQIKRYVDELIYWNEKVNLISRKDLENIYEKHILHSLSVLKYIDLKQKAKCLDIGTGGGLPGIPIAIYRNDLQMTLVESIKKKANITNLLAKHTGIKSLEVICSRAEDLHKHKKYQNHFDYIFSRAVSSTLNILNWSKNLRHSNTTYVLLKGGDLTKEIRETLNHYPNLEINEYTINLIGYEKFQIDNKKVLICKFKN